MTRSLGFHECFASSSRSDSLKLWKVWLLRGVFSTTGVGADGGPDHVCLSCGGVPSGVDGALFLTRLGTLPVLVLLRASVPLALHFSEKERVSDARRSQVETLKRNTISHSEKKRIQRQTCSSGP